LVSPADVAAERQAAQRAIDELNRSVAASLGLELTLWRWETDARPGLHLKGPQGLIDELMDVERADIAARCIDRPPSFTRQPTRHPG